MNSIDVDALKRIFSCIDNTTLEGADTQSRVEQLCTDSLRMADNDKGIPHVAAVCVYPVFAAQCRRLLEGSDIRVASVAGAFPAGQSPISVKVAEVRYAVEQGAQEIDMVISRGALIEGNSNQVLDEISAIREAAGLCTLKVILETGELTPALIREASSLAIKGGADFIKTSTGKITTGATIEAAQIMLQVLQENNHFSSKKVGFKAAGGVSTPEQALSYYRLVQQMLPSQEINKLNFRIGASRLTTRLFQLLTL